MNTIRQSQVTALLIAPLLGNVATAQAQDQHKAALDTLKIEQLTGAKGKLDCAENTLKVTVPRNDLSVTVAGPK